MSNFTKAWKAFWTVLKGNEYKPALPEAEIEDNEASDGNTLKMSNNRRPESLKDAFDNGAIFTLLLLQREGRMIDFLQEDISSFDDAQIGAAVRQIHAGSRKVLEENFALEPVFDSSEGQQICVDADYDPSTMTVIGELPETAPYSGLLQHKGWLATKIDIPERKGKINHRVVCPAEVSF